MTDDADRSFEYYETPHAITHALLSVLRAREIPLGRTACEPCVGRGAIREACTSAGVDLSWLTNDIDTHHEADYHMDATDPAFWSAVEQFSFHWIITNPPFSLWVPILERTLARARIGLALHLSISAHEVLKTGPRRTLLHEHPPTGIIFLPRFAYQRSKETKKFTTDTVTACWAVWLRDPRAQQFITYAGPWVVDALEDETPAYRARVDAFGGRR